MNMDWNDALPIYRQLKERVIAMILDGELNEGEVIPSVRQVAVEFRVNPLTVSKAYQELVDESLVEKRRGLGMYVREGARDALLEREREHFLREEWPRIIERIARLGLDPVRLLDAAKTTGEKA